MTPVAAADPISSAQRDPRTESQRGVLLMVGTMKGAFVLRSDPSRSEWQVHGPHFRGQAVYAMLHDSRSGRDRTYAGINSPFWGPSIATSDDFGQTWSVPEEKPIRFPESSGLSLAQVWQLRPGRVGEPEILYAGVEPAALFESRDGGATWHANEGLLDHEHRPRWTPGAGGLCLHTIIVDPENDARMLIAISAAGVYRTDDGGRTWRARNTGVRAEFLPDKHPEFGQCVHKVVHHPSRPERLFLQNHWGLYRSDDWGDSWTDIANGVPSDFGFAMQMHPHDVNTVYIVPIESDEFRCTPEAKLRVYRTRNGGETWEPLTHGLPQSGAYETILRDALTADSSHPAGVYFGTRSGRIFGSADDGSTWREIVEGLPPVVCVKAATLT